MDDLAELIARSHARWLPKVVAAVLGTDDPGPVAEALTQAVVAALGVPVVGARFYDPGVGIVAGLELADDRSIVAKAHRAGLVTRDRLAAITRVQAHLASTRGPAPRPLAGPLPLRDGWLTVEELRAGDSADGHDPAVRRGMATALHAFVETARPHAGDTRIGSWLAEPVIDGLWHQPHDLRFDFPSTASGAEWIDDAAGTARSVLTAAVLPDIVGHLDWRVQNLAFTGARVSAIYDWDSVGLAPEPAVVGCASVVHPVDWRLEKPDPLPTLEQVNGFVDDYESARGRPFDADERVVLTAAQRWIASYGARCQHSDDALGLFPDVDLSRGWPRLLRDLLG